ncbi:MAG TPA: hypothetical protein VFN89_09420 [Solirubrobacterales bacterium]|nr:hypothetical protein [Solirubrobacterales bacterium]
MSQRIGRIVALSTVSAAVAIGGFGATAASADRNHPEDGPHHGHHHCKGLKGKKHRNCEAHHHHRHGGGGGPGLY